MSTEAYRKARRDYAREWRATYPEKARAAYRRARNKESPERKATRLAYNRAWYHSHHQQERAKRRAALLKSNFGISVDEYERKLSVQNGKCACCDALPSPIRRLAVDHDHDTGKVRGLLCDKCNRALGFLESPKRPLWEAYLSRYSDHGAQT